MAHELSEAYKDVEKTRQKYIERKKEMHLRKQVILLEQIENGKQKKPCSKPMICCSGDYGKLLIKLMVCLTKEEKIRALKA